MFALTPFLAMTILDYNFLYEMTKFDYNWTLFHSIYFLLNNFYSDSDDDIELLE